MSRLYHRRVNTELPVNIPTLEDFIVPSTLRTSTLTQNKDENPRAFKPVKQFVLGGEVAKADFLGYNGLKDKHLNQYFSSRKRRNLLENHGLLTPDGFVIERTTCIRDCEKYKPIPPEKAKDLLLEPIDNGTRILSIQLPQIKDTSPLRSKSLVRERTAINEKIFDMKRQKSSVNMNGIFPINIGVPQSLKSSKTARSKSPPKQFLYCQTPNIDLDFFEDKKPLRKVQIKETPKPHLKISSSAANLYNTLKPLSKEELTSVFTKFKTRALDPQPDSENQKVMLIEQAQKDIFKSNTLSKRNSQSSIRARRDEDFFSQKRSLKTIALKKYNLQNSNQPKADTKYYDELVISKYSKPALDSFQKSKDVINSGHNFSFAQNNDVQQRIDTKESYLVGETHYDASFLPPSIENNNNISKENKFSNFHQEFSERPIEESLMQKTIEESFNFSGTNHLKNTN